MRVVVTGAAGFVGRALLPRLLADGHRVSAVVRSPSLSPPAEGVAERAVGDMAGSVDWAPVLAGAEAVVHLAARVHVVAESAADALTLHRRVNRDGTRRLAEAAAIAGVRRFVFVSTVKVNGERTDSRPFTEADAPAPAGAYARSKLEAEEALAEVAAATGLEAVVLRPPLVYGAGVGGNFRSLLALCRTVPPLPLAAVANRRSLLDVDNLADAVVRCVAHLEAAGRTFLVRDGEDISTPGLIRRLARAMGRPARLFGAPPALLRAAARLAGRGEAAARLLDSLVVDDGQIRRDLGWTPPVGLGRGLERTAAWFLGRAAETTGSDR